ncbi:hypothetical protein DAMDJJ_18600 [Cupriavidus necator]|uniref:hypothetical protein n=1 Tax=Cupriavidus necator TaxID=106590 RepID=UPI003F739BFB
MATIPANATAIQKLGRFFGMSPELLQRVGALVLLCGMVENQIEHAIWAVTSEDPSGKRPSTDKQQISDRLKTLGEKAACHPNTLVQKIGPLVASIGKDITEYRNAIAHGWIMGPTIGGPSFVSNHAWFGELRKREVVSVVTTETLLDMAIECAETLWMTITRLTAYLAGADAVQPGILESMLDPLERCRPKAVEVRHCVALMNSEKS